MNSLGLSAAMVAMLGARASAAPVRHVPPADVEAGTTLELVAEAPPSTPTLTLHYRSTGAGAFATLELVRRDDQHWVAVVPAAAVIAPGVDYFIEAGGEPVFATPAWPHTTPVTASADSERRARDFLRSEGKRSRIHTSAEWVTYGKTRGLKDQYYRVDADFSYRLWAYPLEELRVGYTRLLGDTASTVCPGTDPCTAAAGYKVAGWFELGLAAVEGVRFDTRALVMATQKGFAVGGRLEARLGVRDASHVAAGVEYMADVGTSGFFRLGWGTVPQIPMSATVEITNLPDSSRETGVRLYYDLSYSLGGGVRLGGRIGYAARNQAVAGFTGGGSAIVDF